MCNIVKIKRELGLTFSNIHGKKLFIGYFALGIFGSPEKDWGFVFLLVVVVWFTSAQSSSLFLSHSEFAQGHLWVLS